MSKYEKTFGKLPEFLRRLEELSGRTFAEMAGADGSSPMPAMARAVALAHDGEGLAVDPEDGEWPASIRMKGGFRIGADPGDGAAGNISHGIAELTPLDAALAANCLNACVSGRYMLVRYDLLACYANPFMDGGDDIWLGYDGLLSECRSTVVDLLDGFAVASLPYYKFRNLNETGAYSTRAVADAIEAAGGSFCATEKLDGSMIQMRYIAGEDRPGGAFEDGLLYSTSKTLAGSAGAPGNSHIAALRRFHLNVPGEREKYLGVAKAHPELTFVYEFVHPDADRHVVEYPPERHGLYMTGARDVSTGRLASHGEIAEMAGEFGIPFPGVVAGDLDSALRLQRSGDGSACEGMVADIDGWLVKVKLDGFLALSRIFHEVGGAAGFKSIARMAREGTVDDALPSMPPLLRGEVEATVARLASYDARQRSAIERLEQAGPAPAEGRKAFAEYVNGLACPPRWRGWLFQMRGDGVSCFWADEKGGSIRYIGQEEFEEREAQLDEWEAIQST